MAGYRQTRRTQIHLMGQIIVARKIKAKVREQSLYQKRRQRIKLDMNITTKKLLRCHKMIPEEI